MRRSFSLIFFTLAIIILAISVALSVSAVFNIREEITALRESGANVTDYFCIYWSSALLSFGISAAGIIIALILVRLSFRKFFRIFSLITALIFAAVIFVAVRMLFF